MYFSVGVGAVGRREQLRPSGRLGSSWEAVPEPAERRRTGTKVAERAGTWGLVQRSVFMRLVSRRVPRQSHRVEFARACVRFFEKKRRKYSEKDSTAAPYLLDKTNATRRQAGGWTRDEFCGGRQSTTGTSSRAKVPLCKVRERCGSCYRNPRSPRDNIRRKEKRKRGEAEESMKVDRSD